MSIKIHGKDYVLVNERVQEFHKLYPNGSIRTDLVEFSDERFIIKAEVCPDVNDRMRIFTGYACELVSSSRINKLNALECGESSAVGRAMAFLGIGIDLLDLLDSSDVKLLLFYVVLVLPYGVAK